MIQKLETIAIKVSIALCLVAYIFKPGMNIDILVAVAILIVYLKIIYDGNKTRVN